MDGYHEIRNLTWYRKKKSALQGLLHELYKQELEALDRVEINTDKISKDNINSAIKKIETFGELLREDEKTRSELEMMVKKVNEKIRKLELEQILENHPSYHILKDL